MTHDLFEGRVWLEVNPRSSYHCLVETPAGEDSDSDEEDNPPPPPTVMVPMADLLNHHPNHNAVLKIGEQTVRMEAIRDIEQVKRKPIDLSAHSLVY